MTAENCRRAPRQVEILFDQNDRNGDEAYADRRGAAMSLMIEGWMLRCSSSSSIRPHHQRPGDRELLLLAPERSQPPAEASNSARKQREHILGESCGRRAQRDKAGLEIFSTVSGERSPPCGTKPIPGGPLIGLEARDIVAIERDRARVDGYWPTIARRSEVLTTPLRPSTHITAGSA